MRELPAGWIETTLGACGTWTSGGTPSRARPEYYGAGIPWVKSGDLPDGPVLTTGEQITPAGLANSAAKLLPQGTLSIALYGATIGKLGVLTSPAATNQACANVVPHASMNGKYLFYYLLGQRQELIDLGQGGAQPNISQAILRSYRIPVPPFTEQQRIVAKLDDVLARLSACRDRLDKVPRLIARFRQSVLSAACSGLLTPEFQDGRNWQEQTLGEVLAAIDAGRSFTCEERPPVGDETGVLKISAVTWGTFDEEQSKTCLDPALVREDYIVEPGALLMTRANTAELVGAVAIVGPITKRLMLSDKTLRLRVGTTVSPRWVLYWLRSRYGREQIEALATGNQESMRNISQKSIRAIQILVPPPAERERIEIQVESLMKFADRIEQRCERARKQVEKLSQSVLASAFCGKLVTAEP